MAPPHSPFVDLVRELANLLLGRSWEQLESRVAGLRESLTDDLEERVRVYREVSSGAVDQVILTPSASESPTVDDLSTAFGPGESVDARDLENPECLLFRVASADGRPTCLVTAVLEPWVDVLPDSRVVEVSLRVSDA